jgi:hypothetical protein
MKRCAAFLDGEPKGLIPLKGSYEYKPTKTGNHIVGISCGGVESAVSSISVQ